MSASDAARIAIRRAQLASVAIERELSVQHGSAFTRPILSAVRVGYVDGRRVVYPIIGRRP